MSGPRRKLRSASTRISGIVSVGGDEQRVVSVNDERAVTVWDAQKATPIGTTFSPHNGKVTCVALTARVIISGGSDGFLRLWNLGAEDSAVSLQAHLGAVLCMAVVSHTLATGGVDGVIKVYEIRQAGVLQTVVLYGHAAAVTGVALLPPPPARAGASPGPTDLVSCSLDGTVRVWSLAAGKRPVLLIRVNSAPDRKRLDFGNTRFLVKRRFLRGLWHDGLIKLHVHHGWPYGHGIHASLHACVHWVERCAS